MPSIECRFVHLERIVSIVRFVAVTAVYDLLSCHCMKKFYALACSCDSGLHCSGRGQGWICSEARLQALQANI